MALSLLFGPGLFPLFMGMVAGVLVRSRRLGRIFSVSFLAGICSTLLCVGWFALLVWLESIDLVQLWVGIALIPIWTGIVLAGWVVYYGKRMARQELS